MPAAALLAAATLAFVSDPTAPELRLDAAERLAPTRAAAFAGRVPGARPGRLDPVLYRHDAPAAAGGTWRQYWALYADNPQDRGIVRTGRHEGDWEVVQVRVDAAGRPREAVYAQHAGAERCPWGAVERSGGHPVVHVANGLHAAYWRAGVRDRPWPDPNDEARGGGRVLRPPVERVSEDEPAWMAWRGRWGATRARAIPYESDSPRGPAHQPASWAPDALARRARPCAAGCDALGECDGRETAMAAGGGALLLLGAAGWLRRRRRRRVQGPHRGGPPSS